MGGADLIRNRTFVRLFSGRVITDVGDSLYLVGAMWLVWELTASPFYTGFASALLQIPSALNFLSGPLVDRCRLRSVLVSTQLVNGVGVLLVPAAALSGNLSVWLLLALLPTLKFVNGFVYPAQNAALPEIVDETLLPKANSLISMSTQTVNVFSQAVAGALVALVGAIALFVINSATFVAAAVLFVGITTTATNDAANAGNAADGDESGFASEYFNELKQGVEYVRGSVLLRLLIGGMVVNAAVFAATAVLPAFADSIGGAQSYGLLIAAVGAGNLLGAGSTTLVEDVPMGWLGILGFPLSGVLWLGAVALPGPLFTAAFLLLAMIPIGVFNVLFTVSLQSAVENTLLGRITSIRRTLSSALMPAGALLGGAAADVLGTVTVMYGAGVAIATLGFYYLVQAKVRALPSATGVDEAAFDLQSS